MLEGDYRLQYETLHAAGMAAKDNNDHERALDIFNEAEILAYEHHDEQKRLDALQPAA